MSEEKTKIAVSKILRGDAGAFKEFVDNYKRLVAHIVFRMVKSSADRDDLCQEVFIKAYENLANFHFQSKVSTWLAKIAYNACLNYVEKKRIPLYEDSVSHDDAFGELPSISSSPIDVFEQDEATNRLMLEIGLLPVAYRTIVTLFHLDELSYGEIGNVMDMPAGTVKSYLFRARTMLRERMMQKYQKEELC
jgi:RNA polymerase sigma factor (sigma-70 family)